MQTFKKFIYENFSLLDMNRIIILGGVILYAHGLRKFTDIDAIFTSINKDNTEYEKYLESIIYDNCVKKETKIKFIDLNKELSSHWRENLTKKNQDIFDENNIKNNQNTPTINNHQNNNNINIQMYLNENFKEGPNLMDIVNKMTIEPGYKHKYEKIGYDGIVCEMWKNTLDDIPLKNRPIYCIKDEDPRQEILHVRDGNIWNTVTELEWIKDIYDFENVTNENMTIMNRVLNKLGENILLQLETKYGKHCDFASFKRRNHSDILYPTCLIEIINYIVEHVKIDKDMLLE
jgi:hypothetical protein